jgi:oxygen-independent coproporphyrinogen-3 oxidase
MILISLNTPLYEQDIRELFMAFFPNVEIRVNAAVTATVPGAQPVSLEFHGNHDGATSVYALRLKKCGAGDGADPAREALSDITRAVTLSGDRRMGKNIVKKALYEMLCDHTGRTLPWGSLTGIRPVKLVAGMMERHEAGGALTAALTQRLGELYLISPEKSALVLETALRERELLEGLPYRVGYSLYVGIPFCPTTCLYCSFSSFPIGKFAGQVDDYLDALLFEMRRTKDMMGKSPDTVYVGGGTPTSLTAMQLERLLAGIRGIFLEHRTADWRAGAWRRPGDGRHAERGAAASDDAGGAWLPVGSRGDVPDRNTPDVEFTVEAGRPDSLTPEKLDVMKEWGVGRISINPQTMNQKTLDLIGRRHSVGQVAEQFHMAREKGFDNINMDLIMGLPGETMADVGHTLDAVRMLGPDGLTVHTLAIKRASRLKLEWDRYEKLLTENTGPALEAADGAARAMGMKPYYLYRQKNMAGNFENVGYAKTDKACLYNIMVMEEKQTIVACGAGGTTKVVRPGVDKVLRCENPKDVNHYMSRVDEMVARKARVLGL